MPLDIMCNNDQGGNARSVKAPASPEPTVVPRKEAASLMPICSDSTPADPLGQAQNSTCGRRVYTGLWGGRACGRAVKSDGLCAQHLAGRRRSATARDEKQRERDAAHKKTEEWERVLGVKLYLYNGQVQISEAVMDRIVAMIPAPTVDTKAGR